MRDLNLLYVFEALWRDRSVTLAAQSLGLTQAAVSNALKRLRADYEDKLFMQVGRKMEPTPLAVVLSRQLLEALTVVRRTDNTQTHFNAPDSKRLFTVRTRDIGEVVYFPALMDKLRTIAPGVSVRTVFKPIEETLAGLGNGQIDIALGFLPSLETGIHKRPLFKEHYVCVMREGHPLAERELTLDIFKQQEHLLVEYAGSGHLILQRALEKAGAQEKIKVRLPQYLSAPHFVLSSDLLWTAPAVLAKTLAMYYPLVLKPLPLPPEDLPEFEVALYWHDRYHRDPANRWFRDFVAGGPSMVMDSGATSRNYAHS